MRFSSAGETQPIGVKFDPEFEMAILRFPNVVTDFPRVMQAGALYLATLRIQAPLSGVYTPFGLLGGATTFTALGEV